MLELHLAKSLKHKHLLKLTETTANDYDVDYNEKQIPTKEGKKQRPRKRQRFHCLLFEKIKIYDLTNMFMRLRHCGGPVVCAYAMRQSMAQLHEQCTRPCVREWRIGSGSFIHNRENSCLLSACTEASYGSSHKTTNISFLINISLFPNDLTSYFTRCFVDAVKWWPRCEGAALDCR